MFTPDQFAVTDLRDARQDVNELLDDAIHNAERLVRHLRESKAKFNGTHPSGCTNWTQTDTLNEAINHIENYQRNVNFRDWARKQARLEVARVAVARVEKAKGVV